MSLTAETADATSVPASTALASMSPEAPSSTPDEVGAPTVPHRFSEPQAAYLKTRIPDFRRAQADKSWDETWANIHGGYVHLWPQGPLTAAEITAGITMEDKLVQEQKVNQYFAHK